MLRSQTRDEMYIDLSEQRDVGRIPAPTVSIVATLWPLSLLYSLNIKRNLLHYVRTQIPLFSQ